MKITRLECADLGAGFPDKNLFSSVKFQLSPGDRIAVMGPSGCGKSTLLRRLVSISAPGQVDEGNVHREGTCCYLPQESRDCVLPWKSVRQVLSSDLASALGLGGVMDNFPSELSGGQLRRLALGQILSLQRQILVLDEPLTGLDKDIRENAIRVILNSLSSTSIVVFVTHYTEEADRLATRILEWSTSNSTFELK
ncbi:MAG: hypothetical protein CFE44_13840 [Burkholderiales bacterium PBB4]|nr:MAG: hypothetical protein CFE44_13840 [Burkholderiales bacterium PBB4]